MIIISRAASKVNVGEFALLCGRALAQADFLPVQSQGPKGCLMLEQSKYLLVWARHFFGNETHKNCSTLLPRYTKKYIVYDFSYMMFENRQNESMMTPCV